MRRSRNIPRPEDYTVQLCTEHMYVFNMAFSEELTAKKCYMLHAPYANKADGAIHQVRAWYQRKCIADTMSLTMQEWPDEDHKG